jgi:sulfatase modifying factor 1
MTGIVLTLLLSACAGAQSTQPQGARYAVVVGVSNYLKGFRLLGAAGKDARRVSAALEKLGYKIRMNVVDESVGQVKYLDVLTALRETLAVAQPADTFLFYFAGHGSRRPDANGKEHDYLLLSDTDPAPGRFTQTAISLDTLAELLAQCRAGRRILIIDACRDTSTRSDGPGGFATGRLDKQFTERLDQVVRQHTANANAQTAILYACSPGESSKENDDGGIFSQQLVPALETPHNVEGAVTTGEVIGYVSPRVTQLLQQFHVSGQHPMLVGSRDIVIGAPASDRPRAAVNPKDGAAVVVIPKGPFQMGDDNLMLQNGRRIQPAHRVTLDAYAIYQKPVTVGMFRRFCRETSYPYQWKENEPAWSWQDDHPMVNVTWEDARAYCRWAGGDLPTEAQWEKAARWNDAAGRASRFPWGDTWDETRLWQSHSRPGNAQSTVAAGSYPQGASPYGLLDMAGNVAQWCRDWFSADIAHAAANPTGPDSPPEPGERVIKGSGWQTIYEEGDIASSLQSAFRRRAIPSESSPEIGFRCVVRADAH